MEIWHYLYQHADGVLHNEPATDGRPCEAIPLVRLTEAEAAVEAARGEQRRCAICGFVVDVSKKATAPTMAFPMQGRTPRGLRTEQEDTNRAGGPSPYIGGRLKS